jgi:anti-anti-sigma factor
MKFTLDKKETHTTLALEEDNLNSLIAPDLKSEFVFLRNEGVRNLIFDMSQVKYVDSSGLSAILTANRLWGGYGAFILTGVQHPAVQKLIEISKLSSILTIMPTMTEAVEYVMMEKLQQELTDDLNED